MAQDMAFTRIYRIISISKMFISKCNFKICPNTPVSYQSAHVSGQTGLKPRGAAVKNFGFFNFSLFSKFNYNYLS